MRRIGNRDPVIAARRGNYPARQGICTELEDRIVRAARLEGAGDLQAFQLEHRLAGPQRFADEARAQARRAADAAADPLRRLFDILQRDFVSHAAP